MGIDFSPGRARVDPATPEAMPPGAASLSEPRGAAGSLAATNAQGGASRLEAEVVELGWGGGPEAELAAATLRLENMREQAERSARRQRRSRHAEQRQRLASERRAARASLLGEVVQGTVSIASGALRAFAAVDPGSECAGWQSTSDIPELGEPAPAASRVLPALSYLDAAGRLGGAGAKARAEAQQRDAKSHEVEAEGLHDLADALGEDAQRASRLADRALDHLRDIARARAEARLAAARA